MLFPAGSLLPDKRNAAWLGSAGSNSHCLLPRPARQPVLGQPGGAWWGCRDWWGCRAWRGLCGAVGLLGHGRAVEPGRPWQGMAGPGGAVGPGRAVGPGKVVGPGGAWWGCRPWRGLAGHGGAARLGGVVGPGKVVGPDRAWWGCGPWWGCGAWQGLAGPGRAWRGCRAWRSCRFWQGCRAWWVLAGLWALCAPHAGGSLVGTPPPPQASCQWRSGPEHLPPVGKQMRHRVCAVQDVLPNSNRTRVFVIPKRGYVILGNKMLLSGLPFIL